MVLESCSRNPLNNSPNLQSTSNTAVTLVATVKTSATPRFVVYYYVACLCQQLQTSPINNGACDEPYSTTEAL